MTGSEKRGRGYDTDMKCGSHELQQSSADAGVEALQQRHAVDDAAVVVVRHLVLQRQRQSR